MTDPIRLRIKALTQGIVLKEMNELFIKSTENVDFSKLKAFATDGISNVKIARVG